MSLQFFFLTRPWCVLVESRDNSSDDLLVCVVFLLNLHLSCISLINFVDLDMKLQLAHQISIRRRCLCVYLCYFHDIVSTDF